MAGNQFDISRLKGRIVAIDGPAGSGKSTTAKLVAEKLGFTYLDTGAMYRALTYAALQRNISPSDEIKLGNLARELEIEFGKGTNTVLIGGDDVTSEIRTPQVTQHVSEVSAHAAVRRAMVERQKLIGRNGSVVAEGRETTTVVFPDADLKVYLDADVKTRAERRLKDISKLGVESSLTEQESDLRRRDEFDSGRKHSPLQRAADAVVIDTTNLTIEQQVDCIVELMYDLVR